MIQVRLSQVGVQRQRAPRSQAMKSILVTLFTLAVLFASPSASAALISQEGFDYAANAAVNGRNGGTGWEFGWQGGGTVVEPGLFRPGLATATGALRSAGSTLGAFRTFTTAGFTELRTGGKFGLDGTELWLACLIRREPDFPANGWAGVSLFDGNTEEIFIGMPTGATHWSIQQFDLGAAPGNITSAAGAPIVTGETVLLVVRLSFGVNGQQDRVDLFVNPPPGLTPTVPAATRTGADLQFTRVRVQAGPTGGASTTAISADEIRLGETFADVTPFVPGPAVAWLRPGSHGVSAGAELTLPLAYVWPDGDTATLGLAVTAGDDALLPPDRIVVSGTGGDRRVTFRPPAGPGGTITVTATITPPGGAAVSADFNLVVGPVVPAGLLAHEPFDYGVSATVNGKSGGTGYAGAWSTGIPGTTAGGSFSTGSTNLPFRNLAVTGTRMRQTSTGAQALKRVPALPLGEEGTVRYVSLLVRPDNSVTAAGYFGLVALGGQDAHLFAGKPGGGSATRYVMENTGGAGQVATTKTVTVGEITLLVLKLEFLDGPDRISLFVNPPLGAEPAAPDAVKTDLDLGPISALGFTSAAYWSADELRLGTTFASVTPAGEPEKEFQLASVAPVNGREQQPVALRVTTVAALPAGRTLAFELVGESIGATLDAATGDFAWTPGELDGEQTRTFTVRATSDAPTPETDEVSFTVAVAEANFLPVLADPGELTITEGTPLARQLIATDADLPPQELAFSVISGPEGLAVSESGFLTWTPAPTQLDNVFDVTVQVREAQGGSDARTFAVITRSVDGGPAGPPPPLFATTAGEEVLLQWENLAGSFVLQRADDLSAALWQDLAVAPMLNNGQNHVTRPVTNVQEFFRLVSRGGGSGRLTSATPKPGPLGPGATVFVELNFSGPPAPGDVLEVTETTAGLSHERRIPVEFLTQPDGSLGFFLNGDYAPLGTPRVTARLTSSTGAGRGLVTFEIQNLPAATGGQAPTFGFTVWGPPGGAARRPFNTLATVRPQLYLGMNDPDGDLARVELAFTDPAGTPFNQIVPVSQTGTEQLDLFLYPLAFGRDSLVGNWDVTATAFDRAGNSSGPRTARLNFGDNVPGNAVLAPLLHNISPQTGVPGDVVEVTVSNVPDLSPTNARVRIGGRFATVLEATGDRLRVTIPAGTPGGLVDITVPQGTSVGQANFTVLAAPNVEPAVAHALAGQTLQFRLDRRLSPDAVVAWSVTGGGSIDASGLFRAPDNFTQLGEVTVTAQVTLPGGSYTATALVTVEPAPVARGSDLVAAASGGVVWSENLLARAQVPAGALAADTTISVSVPAQDARPAPPAGSELLGLVELGPDGAQFSTTIAVLVPLTRSLPPGESLPLQRWNPANSAWVDEGVVAVVEPDGQSARAEVSHFSLHGLIAPALGQSPVGDEVTSLTSASPVNRASARRLLPSSGSPARHAIGDAPQITGVIPAFIYEGELRPFYLEGSGLDGPVDLAIVREDGSLMPGLVLGPLTRLRVGAAGQDPTRAAFLLDCPVLPALGENQDALLRIRLRKPGHPDAFVPLRLRGLPEFNVADLAGPPLPDQTFSRFYSEIILNSAVMPRFDVTDLQATHGIRVLAGVDVSGAGGNFGIGGLSGAAATPPRFRTGAAGGNPDGADAAFLALYEMLARNLRVGYGGLAGAGVDDLDDLFGLADCLGANARDCFEAILEDLRGDPFGEVADAPADLFTLMAALPDGRRGASGIWNGAPTHWFQVPSGPVSDNLSWTRRFGPGSGGGGGGKSGELFGDPGTRLGGGAGGEGGGAIRLLSGRGLVFGSAVKANGGSGGNGAQRTGGGITISAGGGGGGGAGAIRVLAGEAVHVTGGTTEAKGGRVGFGGIATRQEHVGFGIRTELPYQEDAPPEGMNVVEGPLFSETLLANSVVTRGVLTLVPRRAPDFFAFDGRPGLSLDPNRPHIVVARADGSEPRRCYFYQTGDPARPGYAVNLLLHPGANLIALGDPGERLLDRHVVFLGGPDTDGDQITDADESLAGTNPASTDTDEDGLGDFEELANGGNPTRADSDGDLLTDNVEIALGTLPTNPDSDGDGLWDSLEVYRGQSPTEGRSSQFSYAEGELFSIVDNEAGEKLLALLDPNSGRLGALGRLPRNRGDGLTFDLRGTLYLAQGDELFEWAGSVPYERPGSAPATGPLRGGGSGGGPGSSGGGVIGSSPGSLPSAPAGAGNVIRDFRVIVDVDGTLKFPKLGNLRARNALGAFTLPVQGGPLTYDPLSGGFNRVSGVDATPGVVGQTFFLPRGNQFTPPLITVTNPPAQAPTAIKALAFGRPTGHFALLAGAANGDDVVQEVDPYNGGVTGLAYAFGRADGTALIHVDTNRFVATTANREVLRVDLDPANTTLTATPLAFTVAPVSRLARVPCFENCFNPNLVTGSGPLGPNFSAQGFTLGDFNADGLGDLAVMGQEALEVVVHILHGNATGTFTAVARHVLGEGQVLAQGRLVLANLDGDGRPDLLAAWAVVTFFGVDGRISVLSGTADGRFAAPVAHPAVPAPSGFAAAQFNGANFDDLAFGQGRAFLVPTDAAGALDFPGAQELLPNNLATDVLEFTDLDGNGTNDLVRVGEILGVHLNGSLTATFERNAEFGGGELLELGDYDGDGNTDLFVSGYSGFIRVFPGHGDGTFDPSREVFTPNLVGEIPRLAVGDLDGDGVSEVVMPVQFSQKGLLLGWSGAGQRYEVRGEIALANPPVAVKITDVNSDGLPDLLFLGVAGTVEVALGR